jgi:hypothetical protein
VTVSALGASTWYGRALDALTGRDVAVERQQAQGGEEERHQSGVSLDDVTSPRAQRNLERVAGTLEMEPEHLLARLVAGQDTRSLLSRSGDAGYGTSIAKSTAGGLAIDQYA